MKALCKIIDWDSEERRGVYDSVDRVVNETVISEIQAAAQAAIINDAPSPDIRAAITLIVREAKEKQ